MQLHSMFLGKISRSFPIKRKAEERRRASRRTLRTYLFLSGPSVEEWFFDSLALPSDSWQNA